MGNVDNWAGALEKEIQLYSDQVNDEIFEIAKQVTEETVSMLKTTGDYNDRTGKYRKSFKGKVERTYREVTSIIYSTKPQLTHLLEYPHAIKGGTERKNTIGSSKAFPHWKNAEKFAISEFTKGVEAALRK